jgi:DnaJ family protein C protein 9
LKEESHTKFQEVAFAYAVSDPARRKRYDRTGSTSESIGADGFSWSDFYGEQFRDIVTTDSIEQFAKTYKGSEEEKDDLLSAYEKYEGKWNKMYQVVMLSDPVDDEERFRKIIEEAIEKGEVKEYEIFRNESKASKAKRMKKARAEEGEAAELAKKLGASKMLDGAKEEKSKAAKKRKAEGHMNDLAAIIQSRQASRMGAMIAHMESKYGAVDGDGLDPDEPSEEAFQKTRKRMSKVKANIDSEEEEEEEPKPKKKSRAKSSKRKQVEESDDEVIDLEIKSDVDMDNEDDDDEEDEEEEAPAAKKKKKSAPAKKSKKAAGTATRKSKRTKT